MKTTIPLLLLATAGTAVSAEDETVIVITATGNVTPLAETATSTTVITRDEIERRQYQTVAEALRQTPGVHVASNGGIGQPTSLFIRGTNSNHVLVMIDGVKINDTTTPNGAFDFANLLTDAIERIEVVRGPQSTLYGSDAIGGVINIITRRGSTAGGPASGSIELSGGSHNTFKEAATLYGGNQKATYMLSLANIDTDGETASAPAYQLSPVDDDGYSNTTLTASTEFHPVENLKVELSGQFIDSNSEFDAGADESPLPETDLESWFIHAAAESRLMEGQWSSRLLFNRGSSTRDTIFDFFGLPSSTYFDSKRNEAEWRNDFHFLDNHTLTAGFKWEQESAMTSSAFSASDHQATTKSLYLQDQFSYSGKLFGSIGIRHDDHTGFGGETTWRIAPVYLIEKSNTRIRASYGTAFNAPSLFQLYDAFSGNPDLEAETSRGAEIGFDQQLLDSRLTLGATLFYNDLDNLIDFNNTTFSYFNVPDVTTRGIESFINYRFNDTFSARLDYTWTDTEDSNGEPLLRRPENEASLSLDYAPTERFSLSGVIHFTGDRVDTVRGSFPVTRTRLGGYTTIDLAARYRFHDRWQLEGKIVNLTDKKYQPVHGYAGAGFGAFIGIKIKI
ncbi:MAG: TonB-dependent receptor [Pseudomonadota bacterium]